jgi:hypothetical protein
MHQRVPIHSSLNWRQHFSEPSEQTNYTTQYKNPRHIHIYKTRVFCAFLLYSKFGIDINWVLYCPYSCTYVTVLPKNPTNALKYVNTTLFTLYTATCFNPQWDILREYWLMLLILIFISEQVFCGPASWNVSILPEDDTLRAETCSSLNRVVLTHITALVGFLRTINWVVTSCFCEDILTYKRIY